MNSLWHVVDPARSSHSYWNPFVIPLKVDVEDVERFCAVSCFVDTCVGMERVRGSW